MSNCLTFYPFQIFMCSESSSGIDFGWESMGGTKRKTMMFFAGISIPLSSSFGASSCVVTRLISRLLPSLPLDSHWKSEPGTPQNKVTTGLTTGLITAHDLLNKQNQSRNRFKRTKRKADRKTRTNTRCSRSEMSTHLHLHHLHQFTLFRGRLL